MDKFLLISSNNANSSNIDFACWNVFFHNHKGIYLLTQHLERHNFHFETLASSIKLYMVLLIFSIGRSKGWMHWCLCPICCIYCFHCVLLHCKQLFSNVIAYIPHCPVISLLYWSVLGYDMWVGRWMYFWVSFC